MALAIAAMSSAASWELAGESSANAATTIAQATFVDFAQCANNATPSSATGCPGGWINGILQASNSHYAEDSVVPQRLEVKVPQGSPATGRTIQIEFQDRKGSTHAYDSLATWNLTQTTADRCAGLTASECVGGAASTLAIPFDCTEVPAATLGGIASQATGCSNTSAADVTARHQLVNQQLVMYGGTLKAISAYSHTSPTPTGTDDYTDVVITYDVNSTALSGGDVLVQLLFGGHLAPGVRARGWGVGLGASSINGGPYHFKFLQSDGQSIGNRDNQISAGGILAATTISTTLSATSVAVGTAVSDSATLTGAVPSAGGTVTYTAYTDSNCSLGAQAAGTKTVTNGAVPNSDPIVFTSAGTYYWQAVYGGDANDLPATSPCGSEIVTVNPATTSVSTLLSATSVAIGSLVHDSATLSGATANAGGTVTYTVYSDSACKNVVQGAGTKTVSNRVVPNSDAVSFAAAGTYYWQAAYSGDASNAGSSSICTSEIVTVNANSPTISTTLSATSVGIGAQVHDTARLSGATANAGGTVSYTVYSDTSCSNRFQVAGTKTVTGGQVPDSDAVSFPSAGTYYWQAAYSGDANNNGNTSPCTSEVLTVNRNAPSIATVLSATSVALGALVHDTAVLSGATSSAGGTATYSVYSDNQCSTLAKAAGTKTVTNGAVPNSDAISFGSAGTYYWQVAYSGDANNAAAMSPCTSEVLTVNPNSTSIATQLSATSAAIGAQVHDSATLSGVTSNAGGSVTYTVYMDSSCSGGVANAGTKPVTNGSVPDSDAVSFPSAGTYYWQAAYSGDANNGASISPCTSEVLTVNPNSTSIATRLSVTSAAIGSSVHDTATLTGATSNAGGTVTYTVYSDTTCKNGIQDAGTKTVTNGNVPNSDAVSFDAAGTYYWQAAYSGDANNIASTSPCTSEIVTINANSPSVSTVLSASSAAIGASVHDSATLSGATSNAGGTVTYTVYGDSECTSVATTAGTKTVASGVVPDSDAVTFGSAGTYYWQAAYSGDANNNGAVSPCTSEVLTVEPNSPSISTSLSAATTGIGTLVHDTAKLSSATANAGGTVSYTVYGDGECTTVVKTAGTKIVTSGSVPDSDAVSFGSAGTYYWKAVYSGDANNDGAVSPCTSEVLTVDPNSPSLSTTLSTTSAAIGASVHDTAQLSGATSNAGGTVSYRVYGDSGCTTLVKAAGSKTVSNGTIPDSDAVSFSSAGTYYWQAVYSGDANNSTASSPCTSEVLTVDRGTPSISTTPNVPFGNVGVAIHDTAKVSGGSSPSGTVTFALYGPGDTTCRTNLVANLPSFQVTLVNGEAVSPDFTTTDVGVYQWVATYNGNANNAPASGACGDSAEQVVTAAVLGEVSMPATGSLALTLVLAGLPLMALGTILIALGRRRREA